MKKFNMNNHIFVKLNENGKKILQKDSFYSEHTKPNEEGIYKFQMWDFMKMFGPHMGMSFDTISEENCVYFNEKEFTKEKK